MNILDMQKNLSAHLGVLAAIPNLGNGTTTVKFVDGTTATVKPNIRALDVYDAEGLFARTEVLDKQHSAILSKLLDMASRAVLAPCKF